MTPKLPLLSDEQFPDLLTNTDVARIFRHVYGGQQFDTTERMFAAEVEAAVRTKFRDALAALAQQAQGEPVAWLYVDTLGERYLCFSRPTGGGTITNLYTTPQPAPQVPALVDERAAFEAWAKCVGYHTGRDMFQIDKYESSLTWELWLVWQARAALQSTAPQATKGQP